MKIIVIGAGVLGSLYAARLQETGNDVTVLGRGARLEEIRQEGLVLEDFQTRQRSVVRVKIIDALKPEAEYDLGIVLVRREQIHSVIPTLQANRNIPTWLVMLNYPAGFSVLNDTLGSERFILGFPGAAGEKSGSVVRYILTPGWLQSTTLGEPSGEMTARLDEIAAVFRKAGFGVSISANMDAWLKTHVALVSPLAMGVYLAGGDLARLAATRDGLILVVRAMRESLGVLHSLNIPIEPFRMHAIEWIPEPILVALLSLFLKTRPAELMIARHANRARPEMKALYQDILQLVQEADAYTPALDRLSIHLNPKYPSMPRGRAWIPLAWKGLWAWLVAIMAVWVGIRFWSRHPD